MCGGRQGGWRLTVLLGGEFRNAWMRLIDVARSKGTLQASATLEHKRIERCNRKGGQRPGYCTVLLLLGEGWVCVGRLGQIWLRIIRIGI